VAFDSFGVNVTFLGSAGVLVLAGLTAATARQARVRGAVTAGEAPPA
jgi:hypothetical protein